MTLSPLVHLLSSDSETSAQQYASCNTCDTLRVTASALGIVSLLWQLKIPDVVVRVTPGTNTFRRASCTGLTLRKSVLRRVLVAVTSVGDILFNIRSRKVASIVNACSLFRLAEAGVYVLFGIYVY